MLGSANGIQLFLRGRNYSTAVALLQVNRFFTFFGGGRIFSNMVLQSRFSSRQIGFCISSETAEYQQTAQLLSSIYSSRLIPRRLNAYQKITSKFYLPAGVRGHSLCNYRISFEVLKASRNFIFSNFTISVNFMNIIFADFYKRQRFWLTITIDLHNLSHKPFLIQYSIKTFSSSQGHF